MKMKKLTSIMASAVIVMGMASCSGSKCDKGECADAEKTELTAEQQTQLKVLETEMNRINKQLPMETVDGLTLTKMEIKDGYMVSTCTYPADSDIEVDNTPEGKAAIIRAAGASAVKRLKDLNLGLKYIYEEEGTGKTQEIAISPEEL